MPVGAWGQTLKWTDPNATSNAEGVTYWQIYWSDINNPSYPELYNPEKLDGIEYSSSDTSVATINSTSGAITLVAPGTTTIKASVIFEQNIISASYELEYVDRTEFEEAAYFGYVGGESVNELAITYGQSTTYPELIVGDLAEETFIYSSSSPSVAIVDASGSVTIVGAGSTTISASFGGNEWCKDGSISYSLIVNPKPVMLNGTITASSKDYDGSTSASLDCSGVSIIDETGGPGIINNDNVSVTATGTFDNADAGSNKTVNISNISLTGNKASNYTVSASYVNTTTTASIYGLAASLTEAPTANTLTYTGEPQTLVSGGSADGGTLQYRLDGQNWSETVPTGIAAGDYDVWYKVEGDANHSDTNPVRITVTIAKATPTVTVPTAKEGLT